MARAARYAGGKTRLARLLAVLPLGLAPACASMQAPPGGPPDEDPPILLAIVPDSGATVEGFDDAVEFQFDEVLTEQGLDRLFVISPRHEEIRVSWKRSRITVRPGDAWRPNVAYVVTMLPGITDLRNNRFTDRRTIVFSTGGPIPDTRIRGAVVDWENGRMAGRGVVEALRLADSLTWIATSDSLGRFELAHLPFGTYQLKAGPDANNNSRIDQREPYDSTTLVVFDSLITRDFWAFRHDTLGPRVTGVALVDSQSVAIEFSQSLTAALPALDAINIWQLPDSTRMAVQQVMRRTEFDSLRAVTRAAARAAADSAAAADSTAADTTGGAVAVAAVREPPEVEEAEPDTSQVAQLLAQRPALYSEIVVVTTAQLAPDTDYWIEATVSNLQLVVLQSGRPLRVPAVAAPDST
ncbi:MAG: Ig-like domain-containing protein [Gemmatimonadetes bacterium]|nr:Ig-like domain-containing protein [Gemmatimonadota bacterium]